MDKTGHPARDRGVRSYRRGLDQDTSDLSWSENPHNSSTLKTHPSLYFFQPPSFKPFSELGFFSLDGQGCYHGDARRLRYLSLPAGMDVGRPSLGWDVMEGFEDRYVPCDEDDEMGLRHILTWLKENRGGNGRSGNSRPVVQDFVTRRGHLTKILCTPYETKEGWILAVTLYKGTLYISERETAAAYKWRKSRTRENERFLYSGHKFENFLCADSPNGATHPEEVVNTNEAFCSVVEGRLESHSFLVSGEVDCKDLRSSDPSAPSCYVELKTSAEMGNQKQNHFFYRYKLLKWWGQSFLLGIPLIIAGFRNPQGRIVSLKEFQISAIPHLVRGQWDPAVCMNFFNAFLSYIKSVVTTDDPRVVYVFSWEPGQDVTYTVEEHSAKRVIPDWYVQELS